MREKFENKDTLEGCKEFEQVISNICIKIIPKKLQQGNKRRIPKERKKTA